MSVRVGTCSWTDPTLLKSGWYPASVKTPEARLAYYASQYPVVEVDSTYYGMPSERNAALWCDRTPAEFTFDVKAFALLTHHPAPVRGIPKTIREALETEKTRVYPKDVPADAMDQIWEMFRSALMPLHSAGKLGAVMFQFPEWFVPSAENRSYLKNLKTRLSDYQIAVEFRRASWMVPEDRAERTLSLLRELDLTYVAVDMPQGFESSLPPITSSTTEALSVVRFHGRNAENWKRKGLTTAERFNYEYDSNELREWVPRVESLANSSREVHVLFNNCYADHAQRNASQMRDLLDDVR
ncbi:MAG: DUF72 domain-containing protein [Actinomycetota bacterium]